MNIHKYDPNQKISGFRFKQFNYRLCVFIHRYRYTRTKERFKEYAERFNIKG